MHPSIRLVAPCLALALLAGCASNRTARPSSEPAPASAPARGGGAYYQDDGPGANPPANLDQLSDAVPRVEPYMSGPNRAYAVFGKEYVPDTSDRPFVERGIGSWYGRKFNGQRTSSGEIYNMYAMTAAHPTLPIPSYARVTNLANGRSVIVRINDRGPFHSGRVIDLSYAAAYKLGYANQGSSTVEVEHLLSHDILAGRYASGPMLASNAAEPSTAVLAPSSSAPVAANAPPPPEPEPEPVVRSAVETPAPARAAGTIDPDVPADLIPSDAVAPAMTRVAVPASGHFVQLGAFRLRAGADDFLQHMTHELDPTLAGRLRVVAGDNYYRVQLGPYSERADAEGAAQRLHEDLGYAVIVVGPR